MSLCDLQKETQGEFCMKNNKGIQISDAEWEVMQVLWNSERPLAAVEVREALEDVSPWNIKTVRTFLTRLVAKKVIAANKQKIAGCELLHYSPLITKEETIRIERKSFLERFFGGAVQSMLSSCFRAGDISPEELEEIRQLIERESERRENRHD